MNRGKLIFGPCGIGKSYYINKNLKDSNIIIEDGDIILKEACVKNKNYYWYSESHYENIKNIISVFELKLNEGVNILYSGNPLIYIPDIIIIIDKNTRWERLLKRKINKEFCPSFEQFEKEENIYLTAIENGVCYIKSFNDIKKILTY